MSTAAPPSRRSASCRSATLTWTARPARGSPATRPRSSRARWTGSYEAADGTATSSCAPPSRTSRIGRPRPRPERRPRFPPYPPRLACFGTRRRPHRDRTPLSRLFLRRCRRRAAARRTCRDAGRGGDAVSGPGNGGIAKNWLDRPPEHGPFLGPGACRAAAGTRTVYDGMNGGSLLGRSRLATSNASCFRRDRCRQHGGSAATASST